MRRYRFNLLLCLIAAAVLCVAGCGKKNETGEGLPESAAPQASGMDDSVLLKIADREVSPEEAELVWRTAVDSLSAEYPGVSLFSGENSEAAEQAVMEYTEWILRAGSDPGIVLSQERQDKLDAAAEAWLQEHEGIDETAVKAALRDLAAAEQLMTEAEKTAETSVTEADARVVRVKQICLFYSDETDKEKQKKRMDKIVKRLERGDSSFQVQSSFFNEADRILCEVKHGEWDPDSEAKIFALEAGQTSEILDSGSALVLYRCITPSDEGEQAREYASRLASAAREQFVNALQTAVPEENVQWNEPLRDEWIQAQIQGGQSGGLLGIYREYLPE